MRAKKEAVITDWQAKGLSNLPSTTKVSVMEIPGNELRLKNKIVQDRTKVSAKDTSSADNAGSTPSTSGAGGAGEQIALSSKAKDIQKAHEVIRSTPDIRTDKVNAIKQKIADGSYKVDSQAVADKILKQVVTDASFLG